MKTKNVTLYRSLGGAACAGAALLMASSALGQNIFVSGFTSQDIYSISAGGTPSTFASGEDYPFGIAFNSGGDLFVANTALDNGTQGYITEITPGGVQSTFRSGIDPKALAFNSTGILFEADYLSGVIYEYTPGGVQSVFATGLAKPNALAFDSSGDLFVGNNNGGTITKITPGGVESTFATGLDLPSGLAFNSAGDLFESDAGDNTIYEFTPGGVRSTFATMTGPSGMGFDSTGNLYVDSSAGTIIKITPGDVQSTFATVGDSPSGLAFQPVPEPSVLALMTASGAVFFACRRGRKPNAGKA